MATEEQFSKLAMAWNSGVEMNLFAIARELKEKDLKCEKCENPIQAGEKYCIARRNQKNEKKKKPIMKKFIYCMKCVTCPSRIKTKD